VVVVQAHKAPFRQLLWRELEVTELQVALQGQVSLAVVVVVVREGLTLAGQGDWGAVAQVR
jgi:hypothetical protein